MSDSLAKKTWKKENMVTLGISLKKSDAEKYTDYIKDTYDDCSKSAFFKACADYVMLNGINVSAYFKK